MSIVGAGIGWFCALWVFAIGAASTYLTLLFTTYDPWLFEQASKSLKIILELAPTLALSGATIGIFVGGESMVYPSETNTTC